MRAQSSKRQQPPSPFQKPELEKIQVRLAEDGRAKVIVTAAVGYVVTPILNAALGYQHEIAEFGSLEEYNLALTEESAEAWTSFKIFPLQIHVRSCFNSASSKFHNPCIEVLAGR